MITLITIMYYLRIINKIIYIINYHNNISLDNNIALKN